MKTFTVASIFVFLHPNCAYETVSSGPDLVRVSAGEYFLRTSGDDSEFDSRITLVRTLRDRRAFVTQWLANSFFYRGSHRALRAGHYELEQAIQLLVAGYGDGDAGRKASYDKAVVDTVDAGRGVTGDLVSTMKLDVTFHFLAKVVIGALWSLGLVSGGQLLVDTTPDRSTAASRAVVQFGRRSGGISVSVKYALAYSAFMGAQQLGKLSAAGADRMITLKQAVDAVMSVFEELARVASTDVIEAANAFDLMMGWAWADVTLGLNPKVDSAAVQVLQRYVNFWLSAKPATVELPTTIDMRTFTPLFEKGLSLLRSHPYIVEETLEAFRGRYTRSIVEGLASDIAGPVVLTRNLPQIPARDAILGAHSFDKTSLTHAVTGEAAVVSPWPALLVRGEAVLDSLGVVLEAMAGAPALLSTVHGIELEALCVCVATRITYIPDRPQERPVMHEPAVAIDPSSPDADRATERPMRPFTLALTFAVDPSLRRAAHLPYLMVHEDTRTAMTEHAEVVLLLADGSAFGTLPYEVSPSLEAELTPAKALQLLAPRTWALPGVDIAKAEPVTTEIVQLRPVQGGPRDGFTSLSLTRTTESLDIRLGPAFGRRIAPADQQLFIQLDVVRELDESAKIAGFLRALAFSTDPFQATVKTLNDVSKADIYFAYLRSVAVRPGAEPSPTAATVMRSLGTAPLASAAILRKRADLEDLLEAARRSAKLTFSRVLAETVTSPLVARAEEAALTGRGISRAPWTTVDTAAAAARARALVAVRLAELSLTPDGRAESRIAPELSPSFILTKAIVLDDDARMLAAASLVRRENMVR